MRKINTEINLTQFCQLHCENCNRGLGLWQEHWHENPDDMTPAMIENFVVQARKAKEEGRIQIRRVKLVGGEPMKAKYFKEIFHILVAAADEGLIGKLKISTNCVDEIPEWARGHPKVVWSKSPVRKKKHTPITWSPEDLGHGHLQGPCSMPFRCGASLDAHGWLPCSAAMFIVKCFDLEKHYRQELPSEPWAMNGDDGLCRHCIHKMPNSWNAEYFATHKGLEHVEPTETWRKALAHYEEKANIKNPVFSNRTPLQLV